MASTRVNMSSNVRAIASRMAQRSRNFPAATGKMMGDLVSEASRAVSMQGIAAKGGIPVGEQYFAKKRGQALKGPYSKNRPVSRTGDLLQSFRAFLGAGKASPTYSIQSRGMRLDIVRTGNATLGTWRSITGKIAALENRSWSGLQALPGLPVWRWPMIHGRPRRFVNKRWSAMLRTARKTVAKILEATRV